jgi:hypothetical protein
MSRIFTDMINMGYDFFVFWTNRIAYSKQSNLIFNFNAFSLDGNIGSPTCVRCDFNQMSSFQHYNLSRMA